MACSSCGQKGGAGLEYKVTTNAGNSYTVATMAEVRIKLNTEGGGSYKSAPKKA